VSIAYKHRISLYFIKPDGGGIPDKSFGKLKEHLFDHMHSIKDQGLATLKNIFSCKVNTDLSMFGLNLFLG